jgi:ACR3 family arsenite efflux pump ArsB
MLEVFLFLSLPLFPSYVTKKRNGKHQKIKWWPKDFGIKIVSTAICILFSKENLMGKLPGTSSH